MSRYSASVSRIYSEDALQRQSYSSSDAQDKTDTSIDTVSKDDIASENDNSNVVGIDSESGNSVSGIEATEAESYKQSGQVLGTVVLSSPKVKRAGFGKVLYVYKVVFNPGLSVRTGPSPIGGLAERSKAKMHRVVSFVRNGELVGEIRPVHIYICTYVCMQKLDSTVFCPQKFQKKYREKCMQTKATF